MLSRSSLLAAALVFTSLSAHADTVQDIISVNDVQGTSSLSLNFSVIHDKRTMVGPTSVGLDLLPGSFINIDGYNDTAALSNGLGFFYAPQMLIIGGTESSVYQALADTDDFVLGISNLYNSPSTGGSIGVTGPFAPGSAFQFYNATVQVTSTPYSLPVTVPPVPAAVTPEPATFALLGTGLTGVAGVLKRRKV